MFKKKLGMLVLSVGLFSFHQAQAATPTPEFACYSGIYLYTGSAGGTDLTDEVNFPAVLFPGTHQAQALNYGLYVMVENATYYYQFPTEPVANTPENMKIQIPQQSPFYIGYQYEPGDDPSVVWSPGALEGVQYTTPTAQTPTDASATAAIASYLAGKIASATDIYNTDLMSCEDTGHCRPKQAFIDALNSCKLPSVQQQVSDTVKALSAMPDCTCPQ